MRILITGASRGLGRAMATRVARDGAALALCASSPSTDLDAAAADFALRVACGTDAQMRAEREALVPLHRIGDPQRDCAGPLEFLLSADATYLTGQNIVVDGGLLGSIQSRLAGRPKSGGP